MSGVDVFFYPESVALVGASGRPGSFSHEMLKNLARGFKGRVYAVNPKYHEILGVPSYPSILEIPDEIDLAVIAVRAERVPAALEEAGRKGVKGAIIVAGGFAEVGGEGEERQRLIVEIARRYSMRIVGPNCIGVYNAVNGLDTFFLPPEKMRRPPKGYIGVVSQSGAFLTTIMDWLAAEHVGIVKAINIGNKADVDEADIISYYAGIDEVNTIMVYIEGVFPGRGRPLVDAILEARDEGKRVIVLKGGRTRQGARAARSHTASLAGDYRVFTAALRDAGAHIVESPTEFVDAAKAAALMGRLPAGGNVLVVTNAGGPGVLASDALEERGLRLPPTPRDAVERLRSRLPPIAALGNPIDLTGDARDDDYKTVLDELAGRSEFDAMLILALVQPATMTIRVADVVADAAWRWKKPTVAVTIGAEYGEKVKEYFESRGVPAFYLPDRGAAALAAIVHSAREPCRPGQPGTPPRRALEIVEEAAREGRWKLLEHEALAVIEAYGVPVPGYCLARSPEEAKSCAARLRGRLAAKIVSPDISHKSDVGGVILDVEPDRAVDAFKTIMENVASKAPDARIEGVLFQEMAPPGGVEIILGARRDDSFGPIVLIGAGGVIVEAIEDVQLALAPAERCQFESMIEGLRSKKLLLGYRGMPPRDLDAIYEALRAVSRIPAEIGAVAEVDVNPLLAYERGVLAVDARILLSPGG